MHAWNKTKNISKPKSNINHETPVSNALIFCPTRKSSTSKSCTDSLLQEKWQIRSDKWVLLLWRCLRTIGRHQTEDRGQTSFVLSSIIYLSTGCFYKLSTINLVWGPLKYFKSNFNPVHVFLHFKSFCLVVLQLILASKLSEWEQFENFAANYQFKKKKRAKITQKSDWCHCQAIKRCLWVGQCSPDSKIEF